MVAVFWRKVGSIFCWLKDFLADWLSWTSLLYFVVFLLFLFLSIFFLSLSLSLSLFPSFSISLSISFSISPSPEGQSLFGGILVGIYSGNLSDISSDIISGISIWQNPKDHSKSGGLWPCLVDWCLAHGQLEKSRSGDQSGIWKKQISVSFTNEKYHIGKKVVIFWTTKFQTLIFVHVVFVFFKFIFCGFGRSVDVIVHGLWSSCGLSMFGS